MDFETLINVFESHIPFNAHLGIKVELLEKGRCRLRVPFQPHLVGDPLRPAMHGGVMSTLADAAGGLAVVRLTAAETTVRRSQQGPRHERNSDGYDWQGDRHPAC